MPSRDCDRHEDWLKGHETRIQKQESESAVNEKDHETMAEKLNDHEHRLRTVERGNLRLLTYASIVFFLLTLLAQYLLK